MSHSLRSHESQPARPPCLSPSPGVYSNSCPSSWWCHSSISSSVFPFSSCPQSLPASGSFPMSQVFVSCGQSTGVSVLASVLPMNTQDWTPLGWTVWISLQSKGLSRVLQHQSRMVLSTYLRLLIFILAVLIPACDSYSPAFLMMYLACKLIKQRDNIQYFKMLGNNDLTFCWETLGKELWKEK